MEHLDGLHVQIRIHRRVFLATVGVMPARHYRVYKLRVQQ